MSKHTPGPWTSNKPDRYAVIGAGDVVASTMDSSVDDAEAIANARLIAAAPELLALAITVAAICENTDAPMGNAARAAIAKATGEQP